MNFVDKHQLEPVLERVRAPNADPRALNELFTKLRPYLHGLVLKLVGNNTRYPLDRSGMVESCVRRILENFDYLRFAPYGPQAPRFLGWIQTIVRHRIIDELRRNNKCRERATDPGVLNMREGDASEEIAKRNRRALKLMAALDKLPERQRQVVELHWFDELSDADIAEFLGGTAGAVKVLRCRALRRLKVLLEAEHDDD